MSTADMNPATIPTQRDIGGVDEKQDRKIAALATYKHDRNKDKKHVWYIVVTIALQMMITTFFILTWWYYPYQENRHNVARAIVSIVYSGVSVVSAVCHYYNLSWEPSSPESDKQFKEALDELFKLQKPVNVEVVTDTLTIFHVLKVVFAILLFLLQMSMAYVGSLDSIATFAFERNDWLAGDKITEGFWVFCLVWSIVTLMVVFFMNCLHANEIAKGPPRYISLMTLYLTEQQADLQAQLTENVLQEEANRQALAEIGTLQNELTNLQAKNSEHRAEITKLRANIYALESQHTMTY